MSDDLPCGWPFEQQAMHDERTLEGMIDSMGLRSILLILQEIAYAKADHIQANWQDPNLAKEWSMCASSGHSLSTTARISSEIASTPSISSMYLCNRRRSAGVMTLPPTMRGEYERW